MKDFGRGVIVVLALALTFGQKILCAAPILYATDAGTQQLFTLSPAHASPSLVGGFGVSGVMAGLAYDAENDILFGSTSSTSNLYSINRSTGTATLIGPIGVPLMHALAFDNSTGILYGAYGGTSSLYRINPLTGAATLIGDAGFPFSGLAFEPVTNILYGTTYAPGVTKLLRIDVATGQATQIGTVALNGVSFEPETGVLYGISNGSLGLRKGLYTVDIATGVPSLVGSLSLENPLDLQFVLAPVPEPGTWVLLVLGLFGLTRLSPVSAECKSHLLRNSPCFGTGVRV